jgi:ureidoglycolate lyase
MVRNAGRVIRDLDIHPLTRDAFAPYGDVIETHGAAHYPINDGTTERYHDLARIDVNAQNGAPLISIFRGQPRRFPVEIEMMERHPLGSQAFIPLQAHDYLLVVARPADQIAPADLTAFRATGRQGVNYHRNVWHHPLLVLHADHDFIVVDRGGPEENCDRYHFSADQGFARLTV